MQLRIFVEPQFGATYVDQLAMARAAESLGFDAFFRSDHFLTMGGDGLPGPTDSWVTLGAIARETEHIRLGTMVSSATFRHPGHLAITVAQVDEMSGGRVELGLGTGWFEQEHAAYGFPFPPSLGERFDRLEEQLEIITGLWRTPIDESFSYAGDHYSLTDSPALPKPHQQPAPPIIVGGTGPKRTPTLAARHAQEFNIPFADLDATREQFARVREACETAGRDPATLVLSHASTVFCGSDAAEVQRRMTAAGAAAADIREAAMSGTPAQIVERLNAFAAAGAQRSYLQLLDISDLDHVALLAAEVMPHID